MSAVVTKREAAFRELEKLVGVHESGAPNRGPVVDAIEAADTLAGNGYSWCQSTQNYAWKRANGELLAGGTASVWFFVSECRRKGYEVERPYRFDHVTYDFHGHGPYDHVGQIERVVRFGPVVVLRTIEGNTSAATSGSQDNGDGVYRKTRVVRRSSVAFFRVPGLCPHPTRYRPARKRVLKATQPKAKGALEKARNLSGYWAWLAWTLGEGPYKAWGPRAGKSRPNVPHRIPRSWWVRRAAYLTKRKVTG